MDPRNLTVEVDFIAEELAGARVGSQSVESGGDDGGGHLLVVEDCDGASCDDGDEDG